MKFDTRYHFAVFLRRFPLFAVVAIAVMGIALAVAVLMPAVYRTEAQLLVEPSQIPGDLASSTVRTDVLEQLQIIQQKLYARSTMLDLADNLALFPDIPDQPRLTPDDIVKAMRDRIHFNIQGGVNNQATLLTIGADAAEPDVALKLANALVSFVLEEDTAFRTGIVGQTLTFFQNEVERLGQDLDTINTAILRFRNENADALPEGADFRMNRQSLLQERLSQARRELSQLTDQRIRLIEVYETTGQVRNQEDTPLSADEMELRDLQNELNRALALFSESNPRVVILRARIEQLEKVVIENAPQISEPTRNTSILDLQLTEIDSRMAFQNEQIANIEAELIELEDAIRRTPANEIALSGLQRDYDNVQGQYNAAVSRLSTAATGERIELLSQGQRVSIIEQPSLPRRPISPNRKLIAIGGTFLGAALGIAAVIGIEMTRDFIRRPSDLNRALGVTPLATLPYIETRFERVRHRLLWAGFAVICIAVLWISLIIIDTGAAGLLANLGLR